MRPAAHTHQAGKLSQKSLSITRRHCGIPLVAVQQVLTVKGYIGQSRRSQSSLVSSNDLFDTFGMIMQHDRNKIAPLEEVLIAAFINMKVEALGHVVPIDMKKGEVRTSPF